MISDEHSVRPVQTFEDNIRPAELLLRVYRLLESETVHTGGDLCDSLRQLVGADAGEDVMLIYNEIFLGLVRERAQMPVATLRRTTLHHLLRQAVVASCTALETYLPSVLQANVETVLRARGRDFVPNDQDLREYLNKGLSFNLSDVLRLLNDPNAHLFIARKILGLTQFSYLTGKKGIHTVGTLLALHKPWDQIATRLGTNPEDLQRVIEDTVERRNNIVHRADRPRKDPVGPPQEISYSWTQRSVDTVRHVCLALDELVNERMVVLNEAIAETVGS